MKFPSVVALGLLVFLPFTLAQTTGGGGTTGGSTGGTTGGSTGGSTGGTTGGTGSSNRTPTTTLPGNQPRLEMRRPVFLTGQVVTQDGDAPPEPARIERVCMGNTFTEGFTDQRGRFSITLGQNNMAFADASNNSAAFGSNDPFAAGGSSGQQTPRGGLQEFSERDLWNCEIRAQINGYQSQVISLAGRRLMDNPEIGILVVRRLGVTQGRTVSATLAAAPKDAKKAYEKGQKLARSGKIEDARKEYEKAIALYPDHAMAHFEIARIQAGTGHLDDAIRSLETAIGIDDKLEQPYLMMASIAVDKKDWDAANAHCDKLLRLNPYDYPNAYMLKTLAQLNRQDLDDAEKAARAGIKQDRNHRLPQLHHLIGVVLAQKNQFADAATHMKTYLEQAPNARNADIVRQQLSEVERLMTQAAAPPQ
jgi:tetratricopeptide (TPR) repeat protein